MGEIVGCLQSVLMTILNEGYRMHITAHDMDIDISAAPMKRAVEFC